MNKQEKHIVMTIAMRLLKKLEVSIQAEINNSSVDEFYHRVTVKEASQQLEVPVAKIVDWIDKGVISSIVVGRRKYVLIKCVHEVSTKDNVDLFNVQLQDDDLPF